MIFSLRVELLLNSITHVYVYSVWFFFTFSSICLPSPHLVWYLMQCHGFILWDVNFGYGWTYFIPWSHLWIHVSTYLAPSLKQVQILWMLSTVRQEKYWVDRTDLNRKWNPSLMALFFIKLLIYRYNVFCRQRIVCE